MKEPIRTVEVRSCLLCSTPGRLLYDGLRDRVYSVPGEWAIWECPANDCGLLWLNPMPSREDMDRVYEAYYTYAEQRGSPGLLAGLLAASKRGYIANRFGYRDRASLPDRLLGVLLWLVPGRPAELDFSIMWLKAQPSTEGSAMPGRLLDVGAGSGWLVANLASFGWHAEGVDFDQRAVERARARGLRVHLGGFTEQRFAESSFDAVTMSHSIEHVHDPVAWLAEARRVLRPAGRLVLATPNSRSLLHRHFVRSWFPLEPPRHLYLFNRETLGRALRQAGFERFRLFTSARDAAGVYLASRSIRQTGRHDMLRRAPLRLRALGRGVQTMELACFAADRNAGEDLVAIAKK